MWRPGSEESRGWWHNPEFTSFDLSPREVSAHLNLEPSWKTSFASFLPQVAGARPPACLWSPHWPGRRPLGPPLASRRPFATSQVAVWCGPSGPAATGVLAQPRAPAWLFRRCSNLPALSSSPHCPLLLTATLWAWDRGVWPGKPQGRTGPGESRGCSPKGAGLESLRELGELGLDPWV